MKTIKTETGTMSLLPPKPGLCPECAVEHAPEAPHNQQSLYYGMNFQMQNGRAPTWTDAMAHCTDEVKAQWTKHLKSFGVKF